MRLLLYIDILGFGDLSATNYNRVTDLYDVIASLNVHKHHAFRTIVFSDTILVYNSLDIGSRQERRYLNMYLCEFAQDLQLRLTLRDVYFRAVMLEGEFHHHELNGIPCFFGPALVEAHRAEKQLKAMGLFMDKALLKDNQVFTTASFDDRFAFVFTTQWLDRVERDQHGCFPLNQAQLEGTDLIWGLVPEVFFLRALYRNWQGHPKEDVRAKFGRTWGLFAARYPNTTQHLLETDFEIIEMCPGAAWQKVLDRYPEDFTWAIKERKVL